ncbi:MAG: PAS domain S-box protein [Deltaproteobacteria bacterium]|nr:PAS domain S-box protein [Deltaproteobacteria bacterium]
MESSNVISEKASARSAFAYALRISLITFGVETLIMFFFRYVNFYGGYFDTFLDSVILVTILTPCLYRWVYRPLLREVSLRREAQDELQAMNAKLNDYARNLEAAIEAKVTELRRTDAQYRTFLETSNDIIIVIDSDMRIVFWNHVAESAFGYTREEALGADIMMIIPERYRDRHREGFKEFLKENTLKRGSLHEVEGVRKNGAEFPIEISISSYMSEEKVFITSIIRDITERKGAEIQIKNQLGRLKALRNIDMAITASLDLRLTLNVILDQITATLHVDAADILLLNQNTMRLEYSAGRGFYSSALKNTRLRIGEGHAGRAVSEGRVVCVLDLKNEIGDFERAPMFKEEGFVCYCALPLISKGKTKGVLEAFSRKKIEHDADFLDFMEALALQAAIAIDNASLFNDLYRANLELSMAYETTLEGWSHALDLRDKETEGHSSRVTEMTVRIARTMGMTESELVHVRRGALLHDIGKMGIPDAILLKPAPLNEEEWKIMRKHPAYAYELLLPINYLRPALDIPYCHHEKWDGTGYPRELRGAEIPLSARIFSVVDVWDALGSDRPYRKAWNKEKIKDYILSLSGRDFDPKVVEVFFKMQW